MIKTFGKKLLNNLGLKILALAFAVVIWIVVVSIDDPLVRKRGTVNVALTNQEYVTNDLNKFLDLSTDSPKVLFYYSTQNSVYDSLSSSDFSATADLREVEHIGDTTYRVPVVITATRYSTKITVEEPVYLEVSLVDLSRRQFSIQSGTLGEVAEGCALGKVTINSANVVTVTGPASIVDTIDSVVATINVGGMSDDVIDYVSPVYYDKDGNVVDASKMDTTVKTVNISAEILNTKDVPLEFLTFGEPAEGYLVKSVSSEPQTVRVKGETSVLNKLEKITIPGEALDVTGINENLEKEIDISAYLPSGVSLAAGAGSKVSAAVEVERITTRTFRMPTGNIAVNGLKNGYTVRYPGSYIEVTVTAGRSENNKLTDAALTGTIEADNLDPGLHYVLVEINLDTDIYTVSQVVAELTVESSEDNGDAPEEAGAAESAGSGSNNQ